MNYFLSKRLIKISCILFFSAADQKLVMSICPSLFESCEIYFVFFFKDFHGRYCTILDENSFAMLEFTVLQGSVDGTNCKTRLMTLKGVD